MDVRLARPTDAPLVFALALDDDAHIVRGTEGPEATPPLPTVFRSLFPMPGRMWIGHHGRARALLEARPRRYVIGWDITRLAARGCSEDLLGAAVCAATEHLQRHGVPRLFARTRESGLDYLLPLDFRPVAREYVLVGAGGPHGGGSRLPAGSRYRGPQDAWPIHQLVNSITPSLVRQLEGSTSLEWSGRRDGHEIVVEHEDDVVAWIGWRTRPIRGYQPIEIIAQPGSETAGDLLAHVLQQFPSSARFLTRVRAYQENVLQAYLDAGFSVLCEETLIVKHARVEYALASRRLQVARVPSISVAPLSTGAGAVVAHAVATLEKDD